MPTNLSSTTVDLFFLAQIIFAVVIMMGSLCGPVCKDIQKGLACVYVGAGLLFGAIINQSVYYICKDYAKIEQKVKHATKTFHH